MQQLHSRRSGVSDSRPFNEPIDRGFDVSVTDQQGNERIRTRHTSQEGLIDDAVERVRQAQGKLTPQGQLDAADEVLWRTANLPMDQRNVEYLRTGDPSVQAQPPDPAAAPQDRDAGEQAWLGTGGGPPVAPAEACPPSETEGVPGYAVDTDVQASFALNEQENDSLDGV
jgi:hypothetical protein